MNITTRASHLVSLVLASVLLVPSLAAAQTAQDCLAAQVRAAGGTCSGLTTCYAKAMKKGVPVSAACVQVKMSMLALNFSEAESVSNCLVTGEAAPIGRFVAEAMDTIATSLSLDGGQCASKKIVALGKSCRDQMRCWARADATSSPVDPDCLAAATDKLLADFAKAEKKGGCVTVGDCSSRSCEIAAVAMNTNTFLHGGGTTTTTTTTSTSSSSTSTLP